MLISHNELSDSFTKLSLDSDKGRKLKLALHTALGGQPVGLQLQALDSQRKMLNFPRAEYISANKNILNNSCRL